jgi:hypothetical protein
MEETEKAILELLFLAGVYNADAERAAKALVAAGYAKQPPSRTYGEIAALEYIPPVGGTEESKQVRCWLAGIIDYERTAAVEEMRSACLERIGLLQNWNMSPPTILRRDVVWAISSIEPQDLRTEKGRKDR